MAGAKVLLVLCVGQVFNHSQLMIRGPGIVFEKDNHFLLGHQLSSA
jgi:hypothetical protein